MKTELFRQLLGKWVIVRNLSSSKFITVKLEFFSYDEKLVHVEFAGRTWFDWIPVEYMILVGVEEKGEER